MGDGKEGGRTYLGGESSVSFEQARAFVRDIRQLLDLVLPAYIEELRNE
jgi:hypothetical protein